MCVCECGGEVAVMGAGVVTLDQIGSGEGGSDKLRLWPVSGTSENYSVTTAEWSDKYR